MTPRPPLARNKYEKDELDWDRNSFVTAAKNQFQLVATLVTERSRAQSVAQICAYLMVVSFQLPLQNLAVGAYSVWIVVP